MPDQPDTQPQDAQKSTKDSFDAQIFAMPERYRHGAQAPLKEPEKAKPVVQTAAAPPPPPPKTPPKPVAPAAKKKMSLTTKVILGAGGLFIILLIAFGAYVYLATQQPAEDTNTQDNVIADPRPYPDSDTDQDTDTDPDPDLDKDPDPDTDQDQDLDPADPFDVEVTPGTDSDSDGLSDVEEDQVYDTNPRLPDSDRDGFLDGNEVFHRYNPNGTAPGTLYGAGLVTVYQGQAGSVLYDLSYPTVWEIQDDENGDQMIDAETGEGFRISYRVKPASQSILDWVENNIAADKFYEVSTKEGLDMIQSENQIIAYVDLGASVIVFEYDTGIKTRVDYLQTFQMMLNSIVITGDGVYEELVEDEAIEESEEVTEEELEEMVEEIEEVIEEAL